MLEPSSVTLKAYGGMRIRHFGECTIQCFLGKKSYRANFYVTDTTGAALFGLPLIRGLNLLDIRQDVNIVSSCRANPPVNKTTILAEFPECFNDIGEMQGTYHITLDPTVKPVVNSPRRVPIALKDEIRAELSSMEEQGVIEKVTEGQRTDWVNSIVYPRKANGKLQICLDPRDLNTAIKREHHVTPTLEEIIPKMSGAKHFSTVDAKCGYWNIRLDEPSSFLTTFNSPFGRYRFKRMPFGLKMSQDIFQARIDRLDEGLPGVIVIADDIIVFGDTQEEHDEHLRRFLAHCQEHGLKLNPEKSQINQHEVRFYGVICSAEGVRPDPRKVSALHAMSAPTNSQELLSFLGLATYMGPFIPNLSELAVPLCAITKKRRNL